MGDDLGSLLVLKRCNFGASQQQQHALFPMCPLARQGVARVRADASLPLRIRLKSCALLL